MIFSPRAFFALALIALPMASPSALESDQQAVIELPKELAPKITTETVVSRAFQEDHRFPAKVVLNEQRVARIGPSISGRVLEIRAWSGQSVHKGDILALLSSVELSNAQAAYIKSSSKLGLLRTTAQKAEHLFKEGIISELSLKERQVSFTHAEVELRALADQLRVMGMRESAIEELGRTGHINSTSPISASIDGTIIERRISVGQIVEISDELFTVADLSQVWVSADIPERAAHLIQVGHDVEVSISALPEHHFTGKIIFVSDTISPETRTVTVRMAVDNPKRNIKPQMLAEMLVQGADQAGMTIPAEAVIRAFDRDSVFVQQDPTHFMRRYVQLGDEVEGRRVVLKGLSPGEVIMVEGVFYLHNMLEMR